jgi:UDP-N-acetyl-D-mannosaminuronic acid dehydrogenase
MPLKLGPNGVEDVRIDRICVVGAGIVGVPMAVLLANAAVRIGTDRPARVVLLQRASANSGWKVDAVNGGRSPIGGIEPDLERLLAENVAAGRLSASSDYVDLRDADVIVICVQTDRDGIAPDYGPLLSAVDSIAAQLVHRPSGNTPLIVFESTLAPSSMATVIRSAFAAHGLEEGRDILLGNSPNRVMPGRLVERIRTSDKLVAGLHPATPELIRRIYEGLVTEGRLMPTNSMTAEVVKTLENAYRDVRIAYSAEVVRYCDAAHIDFFALRDAVNARIGRTDDASRNPAAVPSGGLLVPMVGVGGHCLPKDGILLWWRRLERDGERATGLILESRRINDAAPRYAVAAAERAWGSLEGRSVAVLGASYRADADDTRNSPSLALARLLLDRGIDVIVHDPFVRPVDQNLRGFGLAGVYTRDLGAALERDVAFLCVAHRLYLGAAASIVNGAPRLIFDGCNAVPHGLAGTAGTRYAGIGRGRTAPPDGLVEAVAAGFRAVEVGVANEVAWLVDFLNAEYAVDAFTRVSMDDVRRMAATCVTGCDIAEPGRVPEPPAWPGLESKLVTLAVGRMTRS